MGRAAPLRLHWQTPQGPLDLKGREGRREEMIESSFPFLQYSFTSPHTTSCLGVLRSIFIFLFHLQLDSCLHQFVVSLASSLGKPSINSGVSTVHNNIPYPRERGPTTECPPTPHFGLNFLLRSSVYSNMRPCVAALEKAAQMASLWGLNFVRSIRNVLNSCKTKPS